MNRKALAASAIALGVLLIAIGVYQVNQQMVSAATASSTLQSFSQLGAEAEPYATQLQTSMAQVSGALTQAIFLDFAVGAVLLLAGLLLCPDR